VIDCQNSFIIRLRRKFAAKLSLNFPPHVKGVAMLLVQFYFFKIAPSTDVQQRV